MRILSKFRTSLPYMALCLLVSAFTIGAVGQPACATISVPTPSCSATFTSAADGQHISAKDFYILSSPGDPALLSKELMVLLPPDTDPGSVTVSLSGATTSMLFGPYDIAPSPPYVTWMDEQEVQVWGEGKLIVNGRNTFVYSANSFYPAAHISLLNVGYMGSYCIARVKYVPYTFNPSIGQLELVAGGQIDVDYQTLSSSQSVNSQSASAHRKTPHSARMYGKTLKGLIANYSQAQKWYETDNDEEGRVSICAANGDGTAQYVIITTNAIRTGSNAYTTSGATLDDFVTHKMATPRDYNVLVVTQDHHYYNNDTQGVTGGWGGGRGNAAAENIRAWLVNNYEELEIEYVLLIGDPDPDVDSGDEWGEWYPDPTAVNSYRIATTFDVPMKMAYPRLSSNLGPDDFNVHSPTDYYYADLTGDWDYNNNGYSGEWEDFLGNGQNTGIDLLPELIVGRIPLYTGTSYTPVFGQMDYDPFWQLNKILNKIINYENGYLTSDPTDPWFRNVLLSVSSEDMPDLSYTFGEAIKDDIVDAVGFPATRIYDEGPLTETGVINPCNIGNVKGAWLGDVGFHFWHTHGSGTTAANIFESSYCYQLHDDHPSFTFEASCNNSSPYNWRNLSFNLLRNGAIATVGATNISWSGNNFCIEAMGYRYAGNLIQRHLPCGDALFEMDTALPRPNNSYDWMNVTDFNLYGDPSVVPIVGRPTIIHTPYTEVQSETVPYQIDAEIVPDDASHSVDTAVIKWNIDGGSTFYTEDMMLVPGTDNSYTGSIDVQDNGTTVYYYIEAQDEDANTAKNPGLAPSLLHSFDVVIDSVGPTITHTPLGNMNMSGSYEVAASITDNLHSVQGATLYYSKNGGNYTSVEMSPCMGEWVATISLSLTNLLPGDVVDYYIVATDSSAFHRSSRSPVSGTYSFLIDDGLVDTIGPTIAHTPLSDTGNSSGSYNVTATIVDDLHPVLNATLYYRRNGGTYTPVNMIYNSNTQVWGATIFYSPTQTPMLIGDTIDYYITATDTSTRRNVSFAPTGAPTSAIYSFKIAKTLRVGVYEAAGAMYYNCLSGDPRFRVSQIPGLSTSYLSGLDVLVINNTLPTNNVLTWLTSGKLLLAGENSFSGTTTIQSLLSLPVTVDSDGSTLDDQEIMSHDPITNEIGINEIIASRDGRALFSGIPNSSDYTVLSAVDGALEPRDAAYAFVRRWDGKTLVGLGPFGDANGVISDADQQSIVREACARHIEITSPVADCTCAVGTYVPIHIKPTGPWNSFFDLIKLQYQREGTTSWTNVTFTGTVTPTEQTVNWYAPGTPGRYKVRASLQYAVTGCDYTESAYFYVSDQIKSGENDSPIAMDGGIVTGSFADYFYIESSNRVSGIRVDMASHGRSVGNKVNVVGTIKTKTTGERYIDAAAVTSAGTGTVTPLAMNNTILGGGNWEYDSGTGAGQQGVTGGSSWNNIGLLVKTAGNVAAVNSTENTFTIADGSIASVKVSVPSGVTLPSVGDHVMVAGISSCELSGSNIVRLLLVRTAADIVVETAGTTVSRDIYEGWNNIASPVTPFNSSVYDANGSDEVFDDLSYNTQVKERLWKWETVGRVLYPTGEQFSILVGNGHEIGEASDADGIQEVVGSISYTGFPDGLGTTDTVVSLDGTGSRWVMFGYPYNHSTTIATNGTNVLFTNGSTVKTWSQAVTAGWVNRGVKGLNASTQTEFSAGYGTSVDTNVLEPFMAYYVYVTYNGPLAMIITAQ